MRGAIAAALLALGAAPLGAQTVAGIVRDRATGGPVVGKSVRLFGTPSDTVVARAKTDSLGAFYLQAPGPGTYRVEFVLGARQAAHSPPFVVTDPGGLHQGEYVVDVPAEIVYYEFEVDEPASPTHVVAPTYPSLLQQRGVGGRVIAEFIVDSRGRVDDASFVALTTTHPEFAAAVRAALRRMRYQPAERQGRRVPQLVHQVFDFATAR